MNNIEELNIEYLKINARSAANGVAAISSKWAGETMLALIAQLEAAQKEIHDLKMKLSDAGCLFVEWRQRVEKAEKERDYLLNQEFQQRLANAEHQLYMKNLAIHNIKASRKAQFRKRLAAEAALSAANEKLSKPVVLPPRRSASSFVDEEFSNKDLAAIYNAARIEFSVKITNAGFTVEDE